MLVINGADDVRVVQADTLVFQGRPDTDVILVPGTGHGLARRQTALRWAAGDPPPHDRYLALEPVGEPSMASFVELFIEELLRTRKYP